MGWRIVVVHAVNGLGLIQTLEYVAHVDREKEVAVTENDPSGLRGEIGRKKPRDREFRGGSGVERPSVESQLAKRFLAERDYDQVVIRMAQQRVTAHLPRNVFPAVIPNEYFCSDPVTHVKPQPTPARGNSYPAAMLAQRRTYWQVIDRNFLCVHRALEIILRIYNLPQLKRLNRILMRAPEFDAEPVVYGSYGAVEGYCSAP